MIFTIISPIQFQEHGIMNLNLMTHSIFTTNYKIHFSGSTHNFFQMSSLFKKSFQTLILNFTILTEHNFRSQSNNRQLGQSLDEDQRIKTYGKK